ncbi:MAG: hypothetical protein HMLKMBBP_03764 [Planctomycetes bacterium]|nr:hypothetical protein [Planctomycetota bacterium]
MHGGRFRDAHRGGYNWRMKSAAALPLLLAAAAPLAAGEPAPPATTEAARAIDPRDVGVGTLAPDVALVFPGQPSRKLSELAGPGGLVILARNEDCPVSKRQTFDLRAVGEAAAVAGMKTVLLNVALKDGETQIRAFDRMATSADYALDADRSVANALRIRTTTEAIVLDRSRTVIYRGAIDDRLGVGLVRAAATHRFLIDAIGAASRGARPLVEATTAPGCALELDAPPAPPKDSVPTWHGRISRIVDRHCADCHRKGEAAPFPLTTLDEVRAQKEMSAVVVANRTMPPWYAGESCGPFSSDLSLAAADRDALLSWFRGGMPEGDPKDALAPRARTAGWKIAKPDVVLRVPEPFTVPASGTVKYQMRWVTASFAEDRWVRAFEVRPSAPEVVHHILVFARYRKGDPRSRTQAPFDGGVTGFFAAMVPGQGHMEWPDGMAKLLPAGTDLYFQIHYTPIGREVTDQPSIALRFADGPPREEVRTRGVFNAKFEIPPGAPRHKVTAGWTFPERAKILSFMPHMHLRGTAFRYDLELPDGTRKLLLDVPRYAFDWQLVCTLREPLEVPRGSRVIATAWFDNSAANPHNPDPKATVRFGEQTEDEMLIGYLDWVPLGD